MPPFTFVPPGTAKYRALEDSGPYAGRSEEEKDKYGLHVATMERFSGPDQPVYTGLGYEETPEAAARRSAAVGKAPPGWSLDELSQARMTPYARTPAVADPYLQRLAADAARRARGEGLYTDRMIADQSALARGMYGSQGAGAVGVRQPAAMRAATLKGSGAGVEINAAMQGAREQEMARAAAEASGAQNALWKQAVGRGLVARGYANARDQGALDWLGMGLQEGQETAKAAQEWREMAEQYKYGQEEARRQRDQEDTLAESIIGAVPVVGGIGKAMVRGSRRSDVRAKRDVAGAAPEARSLLRALAEEGPRGYEYRAGMGPAGRQFGPMAQTLEKGGPMGRMMVGKDAEGMRYVKGPEMLKGLLAAVAEQQREIDDLRAPRSYRPGFDVGAANAAVKRIPTNLYRLGQERQLQEGRFLPRYYWEETEE